MNGIDGQLSTFFGWADMEARNWALVGDLTALYDLSAPWALRGRQTAQVCIGIINNGGGRIFQPMFHQPLFENSHDISFAQWAAMWKLEYAKWDGSLPLPLASVIEIRPDQAANGICETPMVNLVALHGFWGKPADFDDLLEGLGPKKIFVPDLYAHGPLDPSHSFSRWTENFRSRR